MRQHMHLQIDDACDGHVSQGISTHAEFLLDWPRPLKDSLLGRQRKAGQGPEVKSRHALLKMGRSQQEIMGLQNWQKKIDQLHLLQGITNGLICSPRSQGLHLTKRVV